MMFLAKTKLLRMNVHGPGGLSLDSWVQAAECPAKIILLPVCVWTTEKPLFEQLATSECIIYPRRPPLFFSR